MLFFVSHLAATVAASVLPVFFSSSLARFVSCLYCARSERRKREGYWSHLFSDGLSAQSSKHTRIPIYILIDMNTCTLISKCDTALNIMEKKFDSTRRERKKSGEEKKERLVRCFRIDVYCMRVLVWRCVVSVSLCHSHIWIIYILYISVAIKNSSPSSVVLFDWSSWLTNARREIQFSANARGNILR